MASSFSALPGMRHLMAYWYQFALLFEALFILTTIDAGTRVARFILQDLGGNFYPRLKDLCWMPGTAVTSFLVVFGWGYFIATGSIATIWPMFGAANQLLGMLALCIGTTILLKMGKTRYIWVTLIPMLFVGIITLTACYELFFRYLDQARTAATAQEAFPFRLNAALIATVAIIAIVILLDSVIKWYGYLILKKPMTNTEIPASTATRI